MAEFDIMSSILIYRYTWFSDDLCRAVASAPGGQEEEEEEEGIRSVVLFKVARRTALDLH